MITQALERVVRGDVLTRAEARDLIAALLGEDVPDVQIAALLTALRMRGETVEEVTGAAEAMRALAVELPEAPAGAVDNCGTGGDGSNTFNISTLAALVVAGCGVPVAKHGNRAASSRCGSAEVLEALGADLSVPPSRMARAVSEVGFGFLYARACHPAMARVAPIRSALGIRTLFNRLGPLTNPMRPRRQLVGVAHADLLEPTARVLAALGAEAVWVVHGDDGLDEVSLCADTQRVRLTANGFERDVIEAGSVVPMGRANDLLGGDVAENAAIARAILEGEKGPRRDVVLLNAACVLCVAGRADDLGHAVGIAARALDSGAARERLERFAAFTREAA